MVELRMVFEVVMLKTAMIWETYFQGRIKSLVRFIILTACSAMVIIQLSECFSKLVSPPISTYTSISMNKTMSYPALTICRSPPYKSKVLEKYNLGSDIRWTSEWANFPYSNATLEQFWDEATYTQREILSIYGLNHRPEHAKITSNMYFVAGKCYTFQPQVETLKAGKDVGYSIMVRHSADEVNSPSHLVNLGWNIYIHDSNDPWTESSLHTSGRQEDLFLEVGEELQVRLSVQDFYMVNEPNGHCNPDPEYSVTQCEERCRWNTVASSVGCGAPWLRGVNISSCSSYEPMKSLIIGYLKTRCPGSCCSCNTPCHTHQYTPYIVNRKPRTGIFSQIYVFYSSKLITKIEEHVSYDWSLFLADLGGSLGFLLGISVIGIVDVLERVVLMIARGTRKQLNNIGNKPTGTVAIVSQKF